MTAKNKAESLYLENYMLLAEYGEEYSEECLISVLSIKFAVKQCDDMSSLMLEFHGREIENNLLQVDYWEEVKQFLLEM